MRHGPTIAHRPAVAYYCSVGELRTVSTFLNGGKQYFMCKVYEDQISGSISKVSFWNVAVHLGVVWLLLQ